MVLAPVLFIVLFVACSNCCGLAFLTPPKQWYNASFDPSPNVIIGMDIATDGPGPITILDSDSGKVGFNVYYTDKPNIYRKVNESYAIMFLLVGGTDTRPSIGAETIVYLPSGTNYTIAINQPLLARGSPINNNATGNVTLWINDPNHYTRDVCDLRNLTLVSSSYPGISG
jgi:hypothetical protein